MIYDHYIEKWDGYKKEQSQPTYIPYPYPVGYFPPTVSSPLTQEEIDELRKLLAKAKEYDEKTGQPDCELEEKKQKLIELAKDLGVDLIFV